MTLQQQTSNTFHIEIGGRALTDVVAAHLVSVVVEDNLHLPDMFVVRLRDTERTILEQAHIQIGSEVTISVISDASPGPQKLIVGEVTALEAQFGSDGSFKIVRGFDQSHRLFRGCTSETYRNVTYSDVAQLIASRNGLKMGTIDTTSVVHDQVSQANVHDWDLLSSIAVQIGFEVAVADGKFHFRKPTPSSGAPAVGDFNAEDPLQLTLGTNLLSFNSMLTSAHQVAEVQVRGWDVAQKRALVTNVPAETTSCKLEAEPADVAGKFGKPTYVAVDTPYGKQADVEASAKAISRQIAGGFAEFEGTARGNPKLRAGTAVSLGLAGKPFDGRYTLTSTRHEMHPEEGYTTWFSASGSHDRSLLALAGGDTARSRIHGVVPAIVTDVRDPEMRGRVKITFPWMSDDYEADWARVVQFGAGAKRGAVFMPEVNDEVLVTFDRGDVSHPYVIGGLYNGVDKPPFADELIDSATGAVNQRGYVSRKGHKLVFVDRDGKESIALQTGDSQVSIEMEQTGAKLTVTAAGDVVIDAATSLSLKSNGALKLSGQSVSIESMSTLDVKGNSMVNIQGSMVRIN